MTPHRRPADICIAIFASRESTESLIRTVQSTVTAAPDGSVVDILVNGNSALAQSTARYFRTNKNQKEIAIRVWSITTADKANAWNQHIHHIWAGESLVFYIDGYVRLHSHALHSLINSMRNNPNALGGTGVPTMGRGWRRLRKQMLTHGGFHGNLCCIRKSALSDIKLRKIRIPLGMYRTDSTIGAILSFGLDPSKFPWNPLKFIEIDANATWQTDKKQWWSYNDVKKSFSRFFRQARGHIENQAIKSHLAKLRKPPEEIPSTIAKAISNWEELFPEDRDTCIGHNPLLHRAMRELRVEKDWTNKNLTPILL